MTRLRQLFNRWRAKWQCRRYGHQKVEMLEKYRGAMRLKNYKCESGENKQVLPFVEITIKAKCHCAHCGQTYIGNVVHISTP